MKLIDIEWKGFASYADKAYVEFSDGLTGIVATYAEDERKSMGAGKSTIVMTILYALFNKGSFKSVSEVVNDTYTEKDHVYVKLRFSKQGSIYTVERGLINGVAYLDLYQDDTPLGENKIASRNDEILKIVSWDYDMFTASIFFEQDKLSKLVDTDGAKRREYIEKILQSRAWTLMQEKPSKTLSKLENELIQYKKEFTALEALLSANSAELLTYIDMEKDISENEEKKLSLDSKQISLNAKLQELKELSVTLYHKRDILISQEKAIDSVSNTLAHTASNLEEVTSKVNITYSSIEEDTSTIAKSKHKLSVITSQLNILATSVNELIEKKNVEDTSINLLMHEVSSLQKSQKAYMKGEVTCDNCEQLISASYAQNKIQEKNDKIESNKKEITAKENIVNEISKTVAEINSNEINPTSLEKNSLEKTIIQLETKLASNHKLTQDYEKEIVAIKKQHADYQAELTKLVEIKHNFLSEINIAAKSNIRTSADFNNFIALSTSDEASNKVKNTLAEVDAALITVNNTLRTLYTNKGRCTELERSKERLEKDKLSLIQTVALNESQIVIENMVLKGFKEIPSNLLEKNIIKIETYANQYVKQFIPYMQVCVREDISKTNKPIEIYYKFKDKERSYRMLSGGQKTIANIGLRLAFSKIISEKTNSISEVIILDEPFGYLDEYSRDLIKNVLSDLQKYYRQIIVISHIDNVTEFPNIINVKMENNKSYIV